MGHQEKATYFSIFHFLFQVILLDVRSHYESDYSGCDILGTEQWKWLEEQLDDNSTALTLVGTGLQVRPRSIVIVSKYKRVVKLVTVSPKLMLSM